MGGGGHPAEATKITVVVTCNITQKLKQPVWLKLTRESNSPFNTLKLNNCPNLGFKSRLNLSKRQISLLNDFIAYIIYVPGKKWYQYDRGRWLKYGVRQIFKEKTSCRVFKRSKLLGRFEGAPSQWRSRAIVSCWLFPFSSHFFFPPQILNAKNSVSAGQESNLGPLSKKRQHCAVRTPTWQVLYTASQSSELWPLRRWQMEKRLFCCVL